MTVEENIKTVEAALEAVNKRDWDRFANYHASSVVQYAPDLPSPLKGPKAVSEYLQGFINAFPDMRMDERQAFGQGDWVCLEFTANGTNKGPLTVPNGKPLQATNKRAKLDQTILVKVVNGKVQETRSYFDMFGLLSQLGMAPKR